MTIDHTDPDWVFSEHAVVTPDQVVRKKAQDLLGNYDNFQPTLDRWLAEDEPWGDGKIRTINEWHDMYQDQRKLLSEMPEGRIARSAMTRAHRKGQKGTRGYLESLGAWTLTGYKGYVYHALYNFNGTLCYQITSSENQWHPDTQGEITRIGKFGEVGRYAGFDLVRIMKIGKE